MAIEGFTVRRAVVGDVPAIVAMLADDDLGGVREATGSDLDPAYLAAFAAIDADPHQELVVAELRGEPVGTLHLTFIPYLSYRGGWVAQVSAVRTISALRGQGLGHELMGWVIERARERGCHHVQLTSDKRRTDAHRFYRDLGFVASHEGMQLVLGEPTPGGARIRPPA